MTTLELENGEDLVEAPVEDGGDGDHGNENVQEDAAHQIPKDRSGLLVELGLILTVLGLSMLLFFLYVFNFTNLSEARAQRQLLNVFTTSAGAVPLSGKLPPNGAPAAILSIPELKLRQVVVQGTTSTETAKGPGVMTQAARPGTIGNAVIIGRKLTAGAPFGNIDLLRAGDRFTLESGLGKFHYVVENFGVTTPGHLDPVSPINKPQLTLVTADQPLSSSKMYYVVARQLTEPGSAPKPKKKPSTPYLGFAGDPQALLPSILLGALYLISVVATVIAYRRFRKQLWTVYVLSTPIVLAIALLWFENLYRLLPATL